MGATSPGWSARPVEVIPVAVRWQGAPYPRSSRWRQAGRGESSWGQIARFPTGSGRIRAVGDLLEPAAVLDCHPVRTLDLHLGREIHGEFLRPL